MSWLSKPKHEVIRKSQNGPPRIGLALGGGGARGFAHIPVLELFDELGIRPCRIAGTSMGALMGAFYASGMTGAQLRALVARVVVARGERPRDILRKKDLAKWLDVFVPRAGRGGLFRTDRMMNHLCDELGVDSFEALKTPLTVVAADFWTGEQVVFDQGPLRPPVQASMSVPVLFEPVTYQGHVLVDGGVVNEVPYDLLMEDCDVVVAVDVSGVRQAKPAVAPRLYELVDAISIMQAATMREKMKRIRPHIYVRPDLCDMGLLDFGKYPTIFEQTEAAVERLRRELRRIPGLELVRPRIGRRK